MPKMIFVNLPVTDLANSIAFYSAIGGSKNPQFSDDTAACMVLSEAIHVMLLTHAKYSSFTARPIADRIKPASMVYLIVCEKQES